MRKGIAIFLFCWCTIVVHGQNLVPNPSFEILTSCPNKLLISKELNLYCPPWVSPTYGSPNIFSTCNTDTMCSVPIHTIKLVKVDSNRITEEYCHSYQLPRTGKNYLHGIFPIDIPYNRTSYENHQIKLLKKLEPKKKYIVGFYTNMSDCSPKAIEEIGLYISKDSIRNYDYATETVFVPDVSPQILNKKGIIKDTVNWVEISDSYKAKGNEQWITIGLFKGNLKTYDSIADFHGADYYFDDVFVYELESIVAEDSICSGDSTPLIANSKSNFYWSSNHLGTDTISLDSIYWVQPATTTNYYLFAQTFKDSLTLTVIDTPDITLPKDTFKCSNQAITFSVNAGYASYLWNTGSADTSIIADTAGIYTLTVKNTFGCSTKATTQLHIYPFTLPQLGNDTALCLEEESLQLTAPLNGKNYLWQPFGETSQSITVRTPQHYYLIITDTNNCIYTDSITVKSYCDYPAWFPNAFTPNSDDTLNAVFKPLIYNVGQYTMQIFNRWGEMVFESNDYPIGWDGSYKGNPCADGVYYYKASYTQIVEGQLRVNTQNGVVHLLR